MVVCLGLLICDKCITGSGKLSILAESLKKRKQLNRKSALFFVFLGFFKTFLKKRLNAVGESFFFLFLLFF